MRLAIKSFLLPIALAVTVHVSLSAPRPATPSPIPLLFELTASGYQARSRDMAVLCEPDHIDLHLSGADILEMRLAGGARRVQPEGVDASGTKIYYRVGPESEWRDDVQAFNKVAYRDVYRGVDLVFYGNSDGLEYDFVVKPGASPSAIQIQWDGGRKLALDANGDLTILSGAGQVRWKAPAIYQMENGVRRKIAGRFRLIGKDRIGFEVQGYDRSRELVIDPALAFSTYLGGSVMERARGIAVDASGNIYVAGFSESLDLPVTRGAFQTGYAGGVNSNYVTGDAFLAKYTPAGAVSFITYLGGKLDDIGMGVALDAAGNPYVVGYTTSTDFPTTTGAYQTSLGGYVYEGFLLVGGDAFVSKLSPDGTKLLYSTYLGGQDDDFGLGITVDAAGNVYVTGTTDSSNFPVTPGAFQSTFAGEGGQEVFPAFGNGLPAIQGGDVFVTKLNPSNPGASALVYSTYIGGSGDDVASSIFVDSAGNAYVGGYTLSLDYPTTPGALQRGWGGAELLNYFFHFGDGFITKLNPTGSALVFSTYIGGSGDDWVSSLTVDSSGNVIATGSTTSLDFPVTAGSVQTSYHGPFMIPYQVDMFFGDAYLLKLNAQGSALIFSTYFGGSGDDCALAVTSDAAGNIYFAGFTNSADFPVTTNAVQSALAGPGFVQTGQTFGDGFLAQFTPAGAVSYASYLGGTQNDAVASIAVSSGVAYLAGMTRSSDFPTKAAAQANNASRELSMGFGSNAFVTAVSGFSAPSGPAPSIEAAVNATGGAAIIAQNTFMVVSGQNLAPDTRIWQSSDFVNNQMPTALDGVSVSVDGKPAFIYYISPMQVNVLTPLDSTIGTVQVQLKTNAGSSGMIPVQLQAQAPGFYQFLPSAYVAATHANGALIGPTSLYPGQSTPAQADETVQIFANGFGQTTPPIVNGAIRQSGNLPVLPTVTIGGVAAKVVFAGVTAPGLYQLNVVIPKNLPAGDNSIVATYNGASTQSGALISISN